MSKKEWVYLGLIFSLGVLLRLFMVSTTNIWFDEAFSYYMSELSFSELLQKIATDRGEPLYYLILKAYRKLFGDSEIAMASLSCIFSSFTPLVLFFLSEEICNKRSVSFLSMFLGAINTASLKLSNYVRFYALLELLVALSYMFFFRALRKRKISLAYVAVSLLGVYTHTYFWFVIISQAVITLLFYRTELRRFCIAFACVVAGFLPWMPVLYTQLHYPASNSLPRIDTLFEVVHIFALSFSMKIMEAGSFLSVIQWFGFLLFITCPLLNVVSQHLWKEIRLVWVPILVSLLIPILISYVASPVYRQGLYDTTINALVVIFMARILYLCPRYVVGAILAILILQTGNWIHWRYRLSVSQTRTEFVSEVKETILTKKSMVVYTGLSQIEPFYYLRGLHSQYTTYLFPTTLAPYTGYLNSSWFAHVDIEKEIESLIRKVKEEKCERVIIFAQVAKDDVMQQQVKKLLQRLDTKFRIVYRYQVTSSPFRSTFFDAVIIYDGSKAVFG